MNTNTKTPNTMKYVLNNPNSAHGGEEIMPGTLHAGGVKGTQDDGPPADLDEDLNWLLTELPRWNDGWGEKWASEAPDAYVHGKRFGEIERNQTMRARRFSGVFGPTSTFLHFRGADAFAAFYGYMLGYLGDTRSIAQYTN